MSDEPLLQSEIILYQTEDGSTRVQCRFENETVWLTQAQMADLFQRERSVITKHIRNIFEEGELVEAAVCANYARTAADGKTYQTAAYNLDVIISVGYRVKSLRGTQFRIWATQRLREYIVKGFTMDDERLKESGGGAYFDELLERIRKQPVRLARRSLRRRPGLAHPCKVNSSAPSALLGDLPSRHSPQDGGGCAFAVQKSYLSLNRRIPNGCGSPRNLTFSPASPKVADSKSPPSDGRNVEMRHLTHLSPFILRRHRRE